MKASAVPAPFPVAFATAGPRNVIPLNPPSNLGAASLEGGFPPATMTPEASGGIPPDGHDMNGILYEDTLRSQWFGIGGPPFYDAIFSAQNAGYPAGAILASSATIGKTWISTADDNTTDPDGISPANWRVYIDVNTINVIAGNPNGSLAGTAGTPPFTFPSIAYDTTDKLLFVCTTTGSSSTAVWSATGSGGPVTISGNTSLVAGGSYNLNSQGGPFTITLPAAAGNAVVYLNDTAKYLNINPVLLARNGGTGTIELIAQDCSLNTAGIELTVWCNPVGLDWSLN